ncbi:MAG: protein kinase [Myxococcota bacterium]|jgi:hypothetical protein|nr:protein kinase [Myxococcota bacterium]
MPSSSSGTVIAPPVKGVPVPMDASMQAPRDDDSPLLLRAARSVAAAGRAHTVVDVLHARALRHYAEGLEQFLALRLGSVDAAELALRKVRVVVAAHESDELVRPPGVRARLYRIAREIARRERATEDALPAPVASLPWREGDDARRHAKLQALRETLDPIDAELLELRYARELRPTELAFVVERDVAEVLEHLHAATERAAKLVLERPGERLRSLLLEAFALRGRSPTLRDEALPAGPAPLAPGALVGGRYRVQARVGTGAFGDVYRAEDIEVPGHVVALKLLHQPSYSADTKQAALRELRHLASVFHPSVVSLKDHGWFDGRLWFVMPWYDGETLESRLNRGPLSRVEARRIFEPLARALAAVHEAGLRHQDVKPENVFLAKMPGFEDDVLPVLIDLGVAATDAEMLVAGTPTYFAPEVAAQFASGVTDKPRVTNKADVFSFALALRNALEPDTQDDVPAGAIESFIEARAVSVPALPETRSLRFLRGALQRWMSLDPEARPTATELANELAVLTAPEDRRRKRRALWRWLLPTLIVLGALASAAVLHVRALAAEETARAAARVAAVREDLEATELERRRLAADADSIRATLENERLGREELQSRLVDASASLNARRAELARVREQVVALEREKGTLEEARASLETTLRVRSTELATLQGQLGAIGAELERERGTRQRLREELSRVEGARDDLEAQIASERGRRAAADARAAELERELDAAIRARQAAERALRDARAAPSAVPVVPDVPDSSADGFEVPFE